MDTLNSKMQEVQEILTCDGETADEAAILSALKTISTVVTGLVHTVGEMKSVIGVGEKNVFDLTLAERISELDYKTRSLPGSED